MADSLSPVVPEGVKKMPVVPTEELPAAPAVEVTPRPGTTTGMSDAYAQAAQSGEPEKMLQFIKSAQGTEFELPAMNAWRGMANRVTKFDEITSAVDKKGGPQSPAGKLELVNQWPKAQNEPSILRGLAEHLMGNPNARFFVSEGIITPKIIYDRNGLPLQQNWTESGRLVNVIDPTTGKDVLPDEFQARGAGIADVKDTLPYVASKEQLKVNMEAANKAQSATNDLASASKELALMHESSQAQMYELFKSQKFQDLLSPDERSQLA